MMYYANTDFATVNRVEISAWLKAVGADACAVLRSLSPRFVSARRFKELTAEAEAQGRPARVTDQVDVVYSCIDTLKTLR